MKRLFLVVALVVWVAYANAQPVPPPPDPGAPVPITGLEWLLAAGGAYGISRFIKRGKASQGE